MIVGLLLSPDRHDLGATAIMLVERLVGSRDRNSEDAEWAAVSHPIGADPSCDSIFDFDGGRFINVDARSHKSTPNRAATPYIEAQPGSGSAAFVKLGQAVEAAINPFWFKQLAAGLS